MVNFNSWKTACFLVCFWGALIVVVGMFFPVGNFRGLNIIEALINAFVVLPIYTVKVILAALCIFYLSHKQVTLPSAFSFGMIVFIVHEISSVIFVHLKFGGLILYISVMIIGFFFFSVLYKIYKSE